MAKRILLFDDPRWLPLAKRYCADPSRFMRETQGIWITDQQDELLTAVGRPRSRVSVASGHGTGKTTAIANIMIWHLFCFHLSVGLLTANSWDQLKSTVWKEIAIAIERIRRGRHGWIAEHIEVLANGVMRIRGYEEYWFWESKTANDKTCNKMSGRHGKHFMIIGDEAATIPDNVLRTLQGALTEENNRFLLTSQGVRNAGFFWSTHHEWAKEKGGDWTALSFSSFNSPRVSDIALKEYAEIYEEDDFRVRVLGLFPQDSNTHFMNQKTAESMYKGGRIIKEDEPYGYITSADVAGGEGTRDKSAIGVARVIGYGDYGVDARRVEIIQIPKYTNKIRVNKIAYWICDTAEGFSNANRIVDNGGMGISVCQSIEDEGLALTRVNWGQQCFHKVNKDRYVNLRAQATHQAARAAKEGRLKILCPEFKRAMISQASRIPKTFGGGGYKIQVPPKGSKEWDGLGSPDLWDMVCFLFLENIYYNVADKDQEADSRVYSNAEKLIATADNYFDTFLHNKV